MVHLSVWSRMWSVLVIMVISLNGVIGSYYWRDYNGTIPSDAFRDNDTNYAIAKIYSGKYETFLPTVIKYSHAPVTYEYEMIDEDIKVLCAEDASRYSWEWVNAEELRSKNKNQRDLVEGGTDFSSYVYIAKIFMKGVWHIGELYGNWCYFFPVPDCYLTFAENFWCISPDCMVLKYK